MSREESPSFRASRRPSPARRRFGQHFLHDPAIIERIVAAIDPRPGEALVEIGPGRGALTAPLLERAGELDVIEIDRELAARLRAELGARGVLRVHAADALATDFAALAAGRALRVVGNLPYNISTPLIFHLLARRGVLRDMHFMLQSEVVERLLAGPGEPARGRLGVMVQYHCEIERLLEAGPGAFQPPPRVRSAFVRLRVRPRPAIEVRDERLLAEVVARAFGQRRKTLRNALRGLLDADQIRAAGVDPGERAERLDLAALGALADACARR